MSDQVLPPPFGIKDIIHNAAQLVEGPLSDMLKDLAEDMDILLKLDPKPDLKIFKSAIILCNEILKEENHSESE